MKKTISFIACVFILTNFVFAQTVKVEKLPTTVEEFVELRNKIAVTPQGGATMFIIALKLHKENPDVGKQCLVIATDRSRLQEGNIYKGFQLYKTNMTSIDRQLYAYPYVVNSYFKGATPENGYTAKSPYILNFSSNSYSGSVAEGNFKIFVKCYGADNPRPIRMIKNNKGYWKSSEWSSMVMGIRKPVVEVDDDL